MVVDLGKYLLVNVFKHLFSALVLICSFSALAFNPSASQIEQFKKLPKSQQQALAKQYGVDLSVITGSSQSSNQPQVEEPTIGPRLVQQEQAAKAEPSKPTSVSTFTSAF